MRSIPARWTGLLAVAAVVVLAAGLAGGVVSPAPTPATTNTTVDSPSWVVQPANTTSYLQVPEQRLERTGYADVTVDAPGALAIDGDQLRVHMVVQQFEHRFNDSTTADNRTAAVQAAIRDFETIVADARERQQNAFEAYNRGDIRAQELFRTLARVDATAQTVKSGADRVSEVANSPLDYSLGGDIETRIANLDASLTTLRGHLDNGHLRKAFRDIVTGAVGGDLSVYVETGQQDIVLGTIIGNTYLRESFIGPAHDPTTAGNESEANTRIQELYTWAFRPGNYVFISDLTRIGNTSVYEVTVTHRQGRFDIYFDWNTGYVYREAQAKRLSDVAPLTRQTTVNGTLELRINATHETGPMAVSLVDNATGAPVNGTVFVDGEAVGTTGPDGHLWTVDSRGQTVVRVETASGSVSTILYDSLLPG